PNGAPSRPNSRLGLGMLRHTQTTCRYSDNAQETMCPGVGERSISRPISARIMFAAKRLTPGTSQMSRLAAIKAEADRAAGNVLPIIAEIRKSGAVTLRAVADALNARGVPTPPRRALARDERA